MTARAMIAIRLDAEALAALDRIAADENRTRSNVIRLLLSEAIAARAATSASDPTRRVGRG
jgi:hypothetical protein